MVDAIVGALAAGINFVIQLVVDLVDELIARIKHRKAAK